MNFDDGGMLVLNEDPTSLTLVAVGDIIPGGQTEQYFKTSNCDHLLGETRQLFANADLVLFNLESPLCSNGSPIPKCGPNHKADPACAYGLKAAGFNIASLANNHILDYGKQGLEETLKALDEAGILRHGAGNSYAEATRLLNVKSSNLNIAFLNFAEGEFSSIETGSGSGAAPIDMLSNSMEITKARKLSDIVIVSVHAGNEYQHFPSLWVQGLYRKYIDFGADIVIAHHPHIPQGIEFYGSGLIAYSLGDFMFEYLNDPGTCVTFALEIQFAGKAVKSAHIHPMRKGKDRKMAFLAGKEKRLFIDHMNKISEPLGRREELRRLYNQGIVRRFESFYFEKLRKNLPLSVSTKRGKEFAAGFLFNMFECRSHSEALQTIFSMLHAGKYSKDAATQELISGFNHTLEVLAQHRMVELGSADEGRIQKVLRRMRQMSQKILLPN